MKLSKWSGVFLIALLAGLAGCGSKGLPQVAAQVPPPTVAITQVTLTGADIYAEYPGQTYARNMVDVRGRVEGYIEKWLFRPGQEVTAGQALYILDLRPFQAQVQQAQGTLQQTEADLSFAQRQVSLLPGRSQSRRRAIESGEGPAGLRSPEAAGGAGRRRQAGSRRRRGRAALRRSQRARQPGQRGADAAHHRDPGAIHPGQGGSAARRARDRQAERPVRHHPRRPSAA